MKLRSLYIKITFPELDDSIFGWILLEGEEILDPRVSFI